MKNIKSLFSVFFWLIIFFLVEGIGALISLFIKLSINTNYSKQFNNIINSYNSQNKSVAFFLDLIHEIVPEILITTAVLVIIPFIAYTFVIKENPYQKISLSQTFFLISISIVGNAIITFVLDNLPASLAQNYSQSTGYIEKFPFLILLLSAGISGPVTEEIFFRYLMMKRIDNKCLAIILPALAFGIAHGNIIQGVYTFLTGLFFCFIYYKTKNLSYTTIMHISLNSFSALAVQLPKTIIMFLIVICIVYTFMFIIWQKKKYGKINIF